MKNSLKLQVIVDIIGKSWDHFDPYPLSMFITLSRSKTILIWKKKPFEELEKYIFQVLKLMKIKKVYKNDLFFTYFSRKLIYNFQLILTLNPPFWG